MVQLAPQRPLGNSHLACQVGVEAAAPFLFDDRVAKGGRRAVVGGEGENAGAGPDIEQAASGPEPSQLDHSGQILPLSVDRARDVGAGDRDQQEERGF